MSRATSGVPSPKESGETVEAAVIDRFPALEYVADSRAAWHDAETAGALTPSDALTFGSVPVVGSGTAVEIKAAQGRQSGGQRGRFYFRQQQHRALVDAGGVYLFVVYAPTYEHPHLARLLVPASVVDELIPSWIEVDGRLTHAKLAWSRIIDPNEVER
ncbi:hypothetical protein [Halobaculum sp. D14]|uniref:hypothetical protein n=1 Tax=Halobaculum sp. D14 TaxID=3421642 RepID=UPI003EB7501D